MCRRFLGYTVDQVRNSGIAIGSLRIGNLHHLYRRVDVNNRVFAVIADRSSAKGRREHPICMIFAQLVCLEQDNVR